MFWAFHSKILTQRGSSTVMISVEQVGVRCFKKQNLITRGCLIPVIAPCHLYMEKSWTRVSGPMQLKIVSYKSRAFKWTPAGKAGWRHCASLFPMVTFFGKVEKFLWALITYRDIRDQKWSSNWRWNHRWGSSSWYVKLIHTLTTFARALIRSAHSFVLSKPFNALSMRDA